MFFSPSNGKRGSQSRGITLVEVVVILLVLVLFVACFLPSGFHGNRVVSKRLVCGSNLKGLGTAFKIYANENDELWPTVPFDETATDRFDYRVPVGGGSGTVLSPNRSQPATDAAMELSPTRVLWMLVRSGDVTPKQFICPNSGDTPDPTQNLDEYYDFSGYGHISYGYQVSFGPAVTRPSERLDYRMAVAADKGPYVDATIQVLPFSLYLDGSRDDWQPYNSNNHGGKGKGEGQNVLFGDGHCTFEKKPVVGVDDDNIYTAATGSKSPEQWVVGESPWVNGAVPFVEINSNGEAVSTIDTVIFP